MTLKFILNYIGINIEIGTEIVIAIKRAIDVVMETEIHTQSQLPCHEDTPPALWRGLCGEEPRLPAGCQHRHAGHRGVAS